MINVSSANGLTLQETVNSRIGNRFSAQLKFRFGSNNYSVLSRFVASVSMQTFRNVQRDLVRMIDEVIRQVIQRERLDRGSRLRLILSNGVFNTSTSMRPVNSVRGLHILSKLVRVLQSFSTISLLNTFLYIQYARNAGVGAYGGASLECERFISGKRCIVRISNRRDVDDCFWQCLALGRVEHNLEPDFTWCDMTSGRRRHELRYLLSDRLRHVLYNSSSDPISFNDIKIVCTRIGQRIIVLEFPSLRICLDSGPDNAKVFMAVLSVSVGDNKHFHYIRRGKIGSIWNRSRFCYTCCKPYAKRVMHRCSKHQCLRCKREDCEDNGQRLICKRCCLHVNNNECKRIHEGLKTCKKMRKCSVCLYVYDPKKEKVHECGKRKCKNCKEMCDPMQHECYLKKVEKMRTSDKYIFYDMECTVTDNVHEVAGIVAIELCNDTVHKFGSVRAFLEWALSGEFKDYSCIAHNGGRYDVHFVKRELLKMRLEMSNCVSGRTFLSILLPKYKVRFIDSYRFIPTSLRKFPKTFGFSDIAKTYFPYRFFTRDKLNYVGPLPSKDYFEVDGLEGKELDEFNEWYHSYDDRVVNLYEMCMDYCVDDVRVLKRGCQIFRQTFMDLSGGNMDPFQYVTIASVCYNWYRYKHLPEDSIAMFRYDNMGSVYEYFAREGISGHDVKDCPGGYYAKVLDAVYVFKVCALSGCSRCFSKFTQHSVTGIPMHDLSHLYNVWKHGLLYEEIHEKTECEWNMECGGDQVNSSRISLRDAFFGGRTEAISMLYECKENERIRYLDYTSLYPCTQFGRCYGITEETFDTSRDTPYPLGYPEMIFEPEDWTQYFGFVRCKVYIPYMHIPPLPARENGKLVFRCGDLEGTWTTVELEVAVGVGARVDHVYEVWHFRETTCDLFKSYISEFMKLKYCAAGWQALCESGDSKDEVITMLKDTLDISVTEADIGVERNHGMYTVSKLCLNSLWGKFAQRSDRVNIVDTYSDEEFNNVVFNDEYDITSVYFHSHSQRTIQYKKKLISGMMLGTTNLAVACFTTSYARVRLYEALKVLGERVLYMDTDSVIFVEKDGDTVLKCGSRLGDLTDELDGDHITKFVSTGPKSYAYRTRGGKHVCKIKGFTLTGQAGRVLNFDSMKQLVLGEKESVKTFPFTLEIHDDYSISTRDWSAGKVFKVTNNKREISGVDDNGRIVTVPFID